MKNKWGTGTHTNGGNMRSATEATSRERGPGTSELSTAPRTVNDYNERFLSPPQ